MGLFLYLQIKPLEEIQFTHPILDQVRKLRPDLEVLDVDNHSDSFLIEHILKQINSSDSTYLFVEMINGAAPGTAMKVINQLARAKKLQLDVFFHGDKSAIYRMLEKTASGFFSNPPQELVMEILI